MGNQKCHTEFKFFFFFCYRLVLCFRFQNARNRTRRTNLGPKNNIQRSRPQSGGYLPIVHKAKSTSTSSTTPATEDSARPFVISSVDKPGVSVRPDRTGTSISRTAGAIQSQTSISQEVTNTSVIASALQTAAGMSAGPPSLSAGQSSSQPVIIPSLSSIVPKPIDPKVSPANQAAAILSHFTLVQQPANTVTSSGTKSQSQSELVLIDSSDDESESSGRSQTSPSVLPFQKLPTQAVEILQDFKKKVGPHPVTLIYIIKTSTYMQAR